MVAKKDADDDRRTVEEIITLYSVEPELRDVIVEGRDDKSYISWYLREHGLPSKVYAIDDLAYIPSEILDSLKLEVGNRGRVLALAAETNGKIGNQSLTFVVDSDFRAVLEQALVHPECVLFTDFASIEGYSLNERTLEKFLRVVICASETTGGAQLLDAVRTTLVKTYLVRAAIKMTNSGSGVVEKFERCLSIKSGKVHVDPFALIRRSVIQKTLIDEATENYVELEAQFGIENIELIRGHDIARVIIYWLKLGNKFGSVDVVEKALMGCLELSDIDVQPMFIKLRERICAA